MVLQLPEIDIVKAVLVFVRLTAICSFLPFFGDQTTPVRARILFCLALSFVFYPIATMEISSQKLMDPIILGIAIGRELIVSFALGFTARLAFEGIVMAANIVGFQMGFGTASLLVADANQSMNAFTAFHRFMVLMLFFSLGLHHIYFSAIKDSFDIVPLGSFFLSADLGLSFIAMTGGIFVIAIKLAAPILVALLFTMAALGLMARTVPQMNVFTLSFPLSFFAGLLVYAACFPLFPNWMEDHFMENSIRMKEVLASFVPG